MSKRVLRIAYIVVGAMVAHVLASYICMQFTVARIEQVGIRASEPRKVYVRKLYRYGAPVYLFKVMYVWHGWKLDTAGGYVFLWSTYVISAAGIFTLFMLAPKLVTEDDSRRKPRYPIPTAASPQVSAAPAPAPAAAPGVAPAAPPRAVTPPPPARAATPPRPVTGVTPPPPARGTTPPRPRRPS